MTGGFKQKSEVSTTFVSGWVRHSTNRIALITVGVV